MQMMIHCTGCGTSLTVPHDAEGRLARCPLCKTKFRVPGPQSLLDETIAGWLAFDEIHEDQPPPPPKTVKPGQTWGGSHPNDMSETPRHTPAHPGETSDITRSAAHERPGLPQTPAADESLTAHDDQDTRDRIRLEHHDDPPRPLSDDRPKYVSPADKSAEASPAKPAAGRAPSPTLAHGLSIVSIGSYGVKFSFNSELLRCAGFRASMPPRCLISGENRTDRLIARPLIWHDRTASHHQQSHELESRYALHLRHNQRPRQIIEAMATLEELPDPFNKPMPYYLAASQRQITIHCETLSVGHETHCHVVVPDAHYALDWLGRVNGICGEDYVQLESRLVGHEDAAWDALDQRIRDRLSVWLDLEPGERFLGYYRHSDLSRADAGLGGIVLTTRNLWYCKYHVHGKLPLCVDGQLALEDAGALHRVDFLHDNRRRKLMTLRHSDALEMMQTLNDLDAPLHAVLARDHAGTQMR